VTIDRKHEQLMQDVLDGTATPLEVERLESWLAGNELGRTRMRELEGIFTTLGRVPAAEAPAGLKEGVLSVLQSRAQAGEIRHSRPPLRSWFGSRARLGFAFAAGLAAGAVVIGVATGIIPPVAPGSSPGVSGTMMPAPASPNRVERTLAVAGARVQAMAWRTNDGRRVSLSLQGKSPAEIELSFDASRLSARTLQQAQPEGAVESRPGRVLVQGQGGEFSFDFNAVDASAPIHVELRAGGSSAAAELPAPGGDATR
jgi:hypothetical protein